MRRPGRGRHQEAVRHGLADIVNKARRELAIRVGAQAAVAPEGAEALVGEVTHGLGADRVIVTAATPSCSPLQQAVRLSRRRGVVVIVGDVGLELTRSPSYEKEVELRMSCSYGPGRYDPAYEQGGVDYPAAYVRWTVNRNLEAYLELVRSGAVRWPGLVEREFTIDDAAEAFALLESDACPLAITLCYRPASTQWEPRLRELRPRVAPVARRGVIQLGIIGAGGITRAVHLPHLKAMRDKLRVAGVATRSGLNGRSVASQVGASFYTTDYRELLARSDVDAVLIATRSHQHAEMVVAALDAGKAVLVEKPLAVDRGQLEGVLGKVAAAGLPFLVGFNRRFSSALRFVEQRLADHAAPPLVLYRVNADPDDAPQPGGVSRAVEEACHMVDVLHALARGPLERLEVVGARTAGRPDANFSAQLLFADGTIGTLVYTTRGHRRLPKERIEVFLGGEVVVVDDFRKGRAYRAGLFAGRTHRLNKGFHEEWERFHAACVAGDPLPIPLETLRSVTEVTFRIEEAVTR